MSLWNWFVRSSADPAKTSATVKGILTLVIPAIVIFAPVLGITLPHVESTELVNNLTAIVFNLWTALGLAITTFGMIRKMGITLFGHS